MSFIGVKEGIIGEQQAEKYLKKQGYKILARNYKVRAGEIDIIARDKKTIVFVEVKARAYDDFGNPAEYVTASKQQKLIKTAESYIQENQLEDMDMRFDVVEILNGKITHIKDAFDA